MVPSVVNPVEATSSRDTPAPSTVYFLFEQMLEKFQAIQFHTFSSDTVQVQLILYYFSMGM